MFASPPKTSSCGGAQPCDGEPFLTPWLACESPSPCPRPSPWPRRLPSPSPPLRPLLELLALAGGALFPLRVLHRVLERPRGRLAARQLGLRLGRLAVERGVQRIGRLPIGRVERAVLDLLLQPLELFGQRVVGRLFA